jgi:hypothetical protein
MAIDTTYWATDLDAMIADLPTAAKFGTTEFTCAASELTTDEALMLCGNSGGANVRIVFPCDAFTVTSTFKPQARLQLKFPSATAYSNYEIVSIQLSPDLLAYEVVLKDDGRA